MEIYYLGHSSFKIKGKSVSLITDPYDFAQIPGLGMKFPKAEAEIVTVSHDHADHNAADLVKGEPFVISGPGEYEVKGVTVFGIISSHNREESKVKAENTIYLIEMDGLRICHLGDLGEMLNDEKLEEINGVDILMIPVGGYYTIDPAQAVELIGKIEPSIVLPMHYKIKKMGQDFSQLATLDDFLKEIEATDLPVSPKLIISKDKIPEERQIVLLETKA